VEMRSSALARRADECDSNVSKSWVGERLGESAGGDKMPFRICLCRRFDRRKMVYTYEDQDNETMVRGGS
jgi:hypothetical protein